MTAISLSPIRPNSQRPLQNSTAPTQNNAKPNIAVSSAQDRLDARSRERSAGGSPGKGHRPAPGDRRSIQLVLATSAPETAFVGPEAFGRMSKSKISVGIARVQQAFGMSTMPLIRPSTGAVPRIM